MRGELQRECLGPFEQTDLDRRLLHGGLPGVLLGERPDPAFFEDWMDSFYARDIQELFGVRNRTGSMALLKLVALRNGGLLDVTDLAKESGMSRPPLQVQFPRCGRSPPSVSPGMHFATCRVFRGR